MLQILKYLKYMKIYNVEKAVIQKLTVKIIKVYIQFIQQLIYYH